MQIKLEILLGGALFFVSILLLLLSKRFRTLDQKEFAAQKFDAARDVLPASDKQRSVFYRLVSRLMGSGYQAKLDKWLLQADMTERSTDEIMLYAGIAIVVTPASLLMLTIALNLDMNLRLLALIGGLILGVFFPQRYFQNIIDKRKAEIESSLLSYTELLYAAVCAGLTLDAAIRKISATSQSILAKEFRRTWDNFQKMPRSQAFAEMKQRCCDSQGIRMLIDALAQSLETGTPMSRTLKGQMMTLRTTTRNLIVTKGEKAKMKMMVPLMIFLLPAFLIVCLAPIGVMLLESFGKQ